MDRRRYRFGKAQVAVAATLVLILAATLFLVDLRRPKTHPFYELRGRFREARTLETWTTPASKLRLVELRNDRDQAVSTAYLREPRTLASRYHILITYTGLKTGRRILNLIPERPDVVLMAIQYPVDRLPSGLGLLRAPYDLRHAVYRTVAGGMLAVSFLEETEHLDSRRVIVVGASLGTTFAVLHGALDPRVPTVLIVHGGGDFPRVLRHIENRRGHPWSGRLQALAAEVLVESFDPLHWVGRIAPRRLVMIVTRRDRYFPVESIQELYDRAKPPKSIAWTNTDHVSSRPTEVDEDVVRRIEEYLLGSGPGGADPERPPSGISTRRPLDKAATSSR